MTDAEQILQVITTWHEATRAGDLAAVLALMTEDVVFLTPGQEPFGKETFAASFAAMLPNVRVSPSAELLDIQVSGDLGIAVSRLAIDIEPRSEGTSKQLRGYAMSVFRRAADGRWQLSRDANLVAPPRA